MSKEKRRVPKLRFPGFTEDWEQSKLGDLMEVTSVKRIHQADWTDSGVRFFRARDIVSSINNEEVDNPVFISEDKYEEYSRISGKVLEGDLLVTGVGTIGVPYLIKDDTPLYFKDGNIIWFKNNNILNGKYFYYCFQNNHIQSQIYSASGKGTVGTYTIENGKKTSISYPSLKEQIKIGKLLDTMTIMITLHQRKLDNLKLKKKALLQKLFPKNGERYPELRFPGFTDAWEQRKLDELTISIGDGLHGTPKYDENGSYYFINGNNLVDSKVSVTEETKKVAFEALSNDDRQLDSTSILMSINGTIGTLARYNNENIMLGKSVAYITPKNINRDFLFYQLQGNVIQSYFYKNLTGTTIKNLGLGTIKNAIVMSTLSEEESKIGQFFYKLDQYITLYQRKLDHLQLQKKALLQQMFV